MTAPTTTAWRAHALLPHAIRWLREAYPDAVIVPELCVGNWGAASLDVGAITQAEEIIGVEIKGDGDSPSRLDRQGLAYGMVATRMWLLASPSLEKRCWGRKPTGWGRLTMAEDACQPAESMKEAQWLGSEHASAAAMLGVLWADELRKLWAEVWQTHLDGNHRYPANARAIREDLAERLPIGVVRPFLCRALRSRDWAAKSKIVFHPGDALPPLSPAPLAAEVAA